MLIISRKSSESFIIGEDIVVNILEVNGDKIKIGIEAPKDIKILRTEVVETINNNLRAVETEGIPDLGVIKKIIKLKK